MTGGVQTQGDRGKKGGLWRTLDTSGELGGKLSKGKWGEERARKADHRCDRGPEC